MLQIKLVYNAEHPYHKDVSVLINNLNISTQDTYFFLIDNFILPDEENWEKVKIVLHFLLSHWQTTINKLSMDKTAYLPFDFSDQYIGCFRVKELSTDQATIQYGFTTKFDGTTLCPSKVDFFKLELDDFTVSSRHPDLVTINKNELIRDIEVAKNGIVRQTS